MSFDPITYAAVQQLRKESSSSAVQVGTGVKIGSDLPIVTDLQGRKFLSSGYLLPHSQVPGVSEDMCTGGVGTTWIAQTIPSGAYNSVTVHNDLFVAVGVSVCATSPDGITWTAQTIPVGVYYSVIASNGLFVAVGDSSVCAINQPILLVGFKEYSQYLYMRIL